MIVNLSGREHVFSDHALFNEPVQLCEKSYATSSIWMLRSISCPPMVLDT